MTNVNPFTHLELQNIPKLPIPPLKDTLDYYLRLLKPLLTSEEFARTKQNVEQFLQTEGPILDVELHELAKKTPTSWLEGIWDTGYLAYRVPCPIHVNPGFSFEAGPIMTQVSETLHSFRQSSKEIAI
jgi:carnitine O-acetyltransferase